MPNYIGYRQRMEIFLEKALPYLVAGLAISMVFVVPLTFSAFHSINTKNAKNVLSGASLDRLEESLTKKVKALQQRIMEVERSPKVGPRGPPGEPGQRGRDGIVGLPGSSGRKGDEGSPGEKGERGEIGPAGPPGPKGAKGSQGEGSGQSIAGPMGPPGPKGDPGVKGQKGDMGAPGMKGDSGTEPSPPIIETISSLAKGDKRKYKVDCIGTCFIHVEMKVESGDADLYAKEDSVPEILNSNCDDCPLCKSRSSSLKDSCPNIQTHQSDHFYLAVVAHKSFKNGELKLWGFNLANVTALGS